MTFLLKLILGVGGTFIFTCAVNDFMEWWEKQPIVEMQEPPFYIIRTYEDIKNGYDN